MHSFTIVGALALCATASAKIIKVSVAPGGDLVFSPSTVKAEVGDQVQFNFESSGHSVAQGDFDNACQPSDDDDYWYSGFIDSGPWTITIEDDDPYPFYCSTPGHCQAGMVGVINPSDDDDETLAAYKEAASNAGDTTSPAKVQGGVAKPAKAAKGSAASSSSAAASEPTDNGAGAIAWNAAAAVAPVGVLAYALL